MTEEIVKEANELATEYRQGWRDNYEAFRKDLWFYSGNGDNMRQWDENAVRSRGNRPTLTVNRLTQFVHQVMNEIRQNSPSIKVLPVDGESDIETAEMLQDLIRNIEMVSKADEAYDTAAEYAIKGGIGFIEVDHDYIGPDSFEQQILIKRINDPMSCLIDSNSLESGGADATGGFKFTNMTESQFKKAYPDANPVTFDTSYIQKYAPTFYNSDKFITLANFYQQTEEEREVLMLDNGLVIFAEQYDSLTMPFSIAASRKVKKKIVKKRLMSGVEVLEESVFPSSYIPLVPVYGEENWVDGRRELYSLIRGAKDSQKMFNYWASMETELLMKAPKAPWLVEEGTTDDYDPEWKNPDNAAVLHYKKTDLSGAPANAPQRTELPQIPTGVVNARAGTVEDMKATMGIYDPSIGNSGSEKSGRAIIATQKQGDTATYHFSDNLSRAVKQVGTIIVDMIPRIYDTPRIVRTLGEDNTPKSVAINGAMPLTANDRIHDLRTGKYDVAVITGASYATKRQEGADVMMQLAQSAPQIAELAGDLIVGSLDVPGADAIAKRLKMALPPQFQENEEGETQDPQVIQLQNALQQAEAQMKEMAAALGDKEIREKELAIQDRELAIKEMEIQSKGPEIQSKAFIDESKLELEAMKLQTETATRDKDREAEILIAQMDNETKLEIERMKSITSMKQSEDNAEAQVLSSANQKEPDNVNE